MLPPQAQQQPPQPQPQQQQPPPGGPGGPAAGGIPPAMAQHIDPRNPLQAALVRRLSAFSTQDAETLKQGVTPQAFAVLKKLLPEIGFVFDQLMGGGAGGGAPGAPGGGAPGGDGGDAAGGPPPGAPAPGAGPRMPPPQNSRFNQMT